MDLKNEIINKSGFLIYTDYWEKYFSKMSGEQIKEVFKIVFHFNKTFEILKTEDLAVEMVISTIIDNIKRDAEKRFKQSMASKENGKLGGRPKKAKPKQNRSKTEANNSNIMEKHNIENNFKGVEIEAVKLMEIDKIKNKKFTKPTIQEIKDYCLERKNNVDVNKFFNYYEANGWKVGKNAMKDWQACVRTWEGNSYNNSQGETKRFMTAQEIKEQNNKNVLMEFVRDNGGFDNE
jgi:hypothetical protein